MLSRQDCSGGGRQDSFTAQCLEAVSCGRRDDVEGVAPRRPVRSVAVRARNAGRIGRPGDLTGSTTVVRVA